MFSVTGNSGAAKVVSSGSVAMIATVMIWASYFIALRSGAQSALTSYDMALLRFMLPALVLLPVLFRGRAKIFAVKKRYLIGISLGAGLPLYLLAVIASTQVQAVVGSLLIPGVAPVFVTIIAVIFYAESLSKRRALGLGAVLIGVAVLVVGEFSANAQASIVGPLLYLLAAVLWAIYTVSVRVAKLSGLEVASILNITAAVVLLLFLPTATFESNLNQVAMDQILPQLLIMGVFCGLISVVTYAHAIGHLGAELSSCWGALTPVLVSVLAYILLAEQLNLQTATAMLLIMLGVMVANSKNKQRCDQH